MALPDLQPRKIHNPTTASWRITENEAAGSRLVTATGGIMPADHHIPRDIPIVVFGGRRSGLGMGLQIDYLRNFPPGTVARVYWTGKKVPREEGARAIRHSLDERLAAGERIVAFAGTGGEHNSHLTTGGPPPDPVRAAKYGKIDLHRDTSDGTLIETALEYGIPVDKTCKTMQLLLNLLTKELPPHLRAIPQDHDQDHHHGKMEYPEGTVLNEHAVKDVLDESIRQSLRIELPRVTRVNSAHSQGFTIDSLSPEALALLAQKGWYPWLISDIPEEPIGRQTYEAFLHVAPDGRILGYAGQDHSESPHAPEGRLLRGFRRQIHTANLIPAWLK